MLTLSSFIPFAYLLTCIFAVYGLMAMAFAPVPAFLSLCLLLVAQVTGHEVGRKRWLWSAVAFMIVGAASWVFQANIGYILS